MLRIRWLPVVLLIAFVGTRAGRSEEPDRNLIELRRDAKALQKACDDIRLWTAIQLAEKVHVGATCLLPADSAERGNYLELAAHVYRHTYRYAEADTLHQEVLGIRRKGCPPGAAGAPRGKLVQSLFHLGDLATARGDITSASRWFDEGLTELTPQTADHDLHKVGLLNGLGAVDAVNGDLLRAETRLRTAAELCDGADPQYAGVAARIRANLANVHLVYGADAVTRGDPAGALPHLKRAGDEAKKAGEFFAALNKRAGGLSPTETIEFLNVLLVQNQILMTAQKDAFAAASLERLLTNMRGSMGSTLEASYRLSLAKCRIALGDAEAAERECRAALRLLMNYHQYHDVMPEITAVKMELAMVLALRRDPARAAEAGRLARDAFREDLLVLERGFGYLTDRQRLLAQKSRSGSLGMYLTITRAESGSTPADVYGDVLAWKGVVTARTTFDRTVRSANGAAGAELEAGRRTLRHAVEAYNGWARSPRPAETDAVTWETVGVERRDAVDRADRQLAAAIQTRLPAGAAPTVAQLTDAIPDGTLLVDYIAYRPFEPDPAGRVTLGALKVAAFLSRKGRPTARVDLPEPAAAITAALDRWDRALPREKDSRPASEIEAALRPPLDALGKVVWEPLANHPYLDGAARVLVSPDDVLWRVPFAALPGRDRSKYLVEEHEIGHVFSGRHVYDLFRGYGTYAPTPAPASGCLVIGAIEYGPKTRPEHLEQITIGPAWLGDVRVKYAERVGREPEVIAGPDATGPAVLKRIVGGTLGEVHLLGHGPQFDTPPKDWRAGFGRVRVPLAGVNLDPPGRPGANAPDDELLGRLDLRGMRAFWWWGCHVNGGARVAGEAVIGAPRALYLAGCQAVLGSLWDVDAGRTKTLCGRVNERAWQSGTRPAAAFVGAQRLGLARDQKARLRPDWWAGWILIGDTTPPTVPASPPNHNVQPEETKIVQPEEPVAATPSWGAFEYSAVSLLVLTSGGVAWLLYSRLRRRIVPSQLD